MAWRWTFGGLVAMLGGVAGAASFGDARLEIAFDDRTGAARRGRRALPCVADRAWGVDMGVCVALWVGMW